MKIIIPDYPKRQVQKLSRLTRRWRKIHRYLGLILAVFLLISAVTGIFLGWKKEADILQPPTQKGTATGLGKWLPLENLTNRSTLALNEKLKATYNIYRIDVRPDKGIAKITYKPGYWEVQIDGASGEVLSIEKRYSDLLEKIHDGSIISDAFKLVSMNLLGVGIIFMIISGLWLWYSPKKIRKLKN